MVPVFACKHIGIFKIRAIALALFVLVLEKEDKDNDMLINHEYIHIRQQWELVVFPFLCIYIFEYVRNVWNGMTTKDAYRNISFEREAKVNERNFNYLLKRKRNAWKNYRNK